MKKLFFLFYLRSFYAFKRKSFKQEANNELDQNISVVSYLSNNMLLWEITWVNKVIQNVKSQINFLQTAI